MNVKNVVATIEVDYTLVCQGIGTRREGTNQPALLGENGFEQNWDLWTFRDSGWHLYFYEFMISCVRFFSLINDH
jgi:hypothetical protein